MSEFRSKVVAGAYRISGATDLNKIGLTDSDVYSHGILIYMPNTMGQFFMYVGHSENLPQDYRLDRCFISCDLRVDNQPLNQIRWWRINNLTKNNLYTP